MIDKEWGGTQKLITLKLRYDELILFKIHFFKVPFSIGYKEKIHKKNLSNSML